MTQRFFQLKPLFFGVVSLTLHTTNDNEQERQNQTGSNRDVEENDKEKMDRQKINERVLEEIREKRQLMKMIESRKIKLVGHISFETTTL